MTSEQLLRILNTIDFTERYWDLCERFRVPPGASYAGSKEEILLAFKAAGVPVKYDSRDRSYALEPETIGEMAWGGLFAKQRVGPELFFSGEGPAGRVGSNFAVLAYDAKRLAEPSFSRSPFQGPAPYPRPTIANPESLVMLVREFTTMVHEIKLAIRAREVAV